MGREIYDIINDMAEVLNASQMQKLQEVLVKRLSENTVSDYLQTTNMDFLDMFLTWNKQEFSHLCRWRDELQDIFIKSKKEHLFYMQKCAII